MSKNKSFKKNPKKREVKDLILSLFNHLELLVDYSDGAFSRYESDKYLGEVAGKLRLLVITRGQQNGLLLKLMDYFSYERLWSSNTPNWKEPFTLRTYMHFLAGYYNGKFNLSNEQVVRFTSQQIGSAHEDWEIDEQLINASDINNISINGSHFLHDTLRRISNTVLHEGFLFLLHLYSEKHLHELGLDLDLRRIMLLDVHFPDHLNTPIIERQHSIKYEKTNYSIVEYDTAVLQNKVSNKYVINGLISKTQYKNNGPRQAFWLEWIDTSKYFETGKHVVLKGKKKLF